MNIKIGKTNPYRQAPSLQPLNESQQMVSATVNGQQQEPLNQQDAQIGDVFSIKSKQFKFESGKIMGSLTSDLDDIPFSLKYHANVTSNFEEFTASVAKFLKGTGAELTPNDITKLQFHYEKHHKL